MDLYFFNPGCEIEVAEGKAVYSLPKYPAMLERDLSMLPMCLAAKGDCVLAARTQDVNFKEFFKDYFPCEFIDVDAKGGQAREFNFFRPWGISPRALRIGEKFKFSDRYYDSPIGRWTPQHKQLFSRATSAAFFEKLTTFSDYDEQLMTTKSQLPIIAETWDEAEDFFYKHTQGSVFKAVFGSSGRGIRILTDTVMTPNLKNWIRSIIKNQNAIACEHLFEKVVDFSMHYDIEGGKAIFVGVSTFNTSDTGSYIGSKVGRLEELPLIKPLTANELSGLHIKALNDSPYTKFYCGPLGIDCMVYREQGQLKVNPCIEINCRHSMGRLAMQISDLADGDATFLVFNKTAPPVPTDRKPSFSNGKLVGGFLPLTPRDTVAFAAGIYCR